MGMLTCVTPSASLPAWPGHLHFELADYSTTSPPSSSSPCAAPVAMDEGGAGSRDDQTPSSSSRRFVDLSGDALCEALLEEHGDDGSREGVARLLERTLREQCVTTTLPPAAHFSLLARARSAAAFAGGERGRLGASRRRYGVAQRLRALLALVSGMGQQPEACSALETFLQSEPELTYELVDLVQNNNANNPSSNNDLDGRAVVPLAIQVREKTTKTTKKNRLFYAFPSALFVCLLEWPTDP